MIPEMNTGNDEGLILTHNHKNVHKIKHDSKRAIGWHGKSIWSKQRSFHPDNYLMSSTKLSLIRMSHPLLNTNPGITSQSQVPEGYVHLLWESTQSHSHTYQPWLQGTSLCHSMADNPDHYACGPLCACVLKHSTEVSLIMRWSEICCC